MYGLSVVLAVFLVFAGPSCTGSDNLALLIDTLKTVHRTVCDDEQVSLACPTGTSISIQVAQYGNAAPKDQGCVAETTLIGTEGEKKCKWPNSMQYSLLQTVVQECQKKSQCIFSTTLKPGLADPCPSARKYVEMAYKCRPFEFRSRTVCENEVVKLSCNRNSRIAIFDAKYGRTPYETISCPQAQGLPDEKCSAPYTVEKVMQICLGRRRCQIVVNARNFESTCKPHTTPYLKIVYACVPLGVLNERYESAMERDEIDEDNVQNGNLFDESEEAGEKFSEPGTGSAVQLPAGEPTIDLDKIEETTVRATKIPLQKGPDTILNPNIFMYTGLTITIIVICILIFIGFYCYKTRKEKNNSKNGNMFSTEAPNVFSDIASDVDNDVDVSHISGTFYDPLHPDMMVYRDGVTRNTIRAMRPLSTVYPCAGVSMYGNMDTMPSQSRNIDARFTRSRCKEEQSTPELLSPRCLGTDSNSQFYYGWRQEL